MEARLRGALWAVVAAICVGTPLELLLLEHWGSPIQAVPFALSALGLLAAAAVLLRPGPTTIKASRWAMALVGLGGLFGTWEHLEHNAEFAVEIDSTIGGSALLVEALTGANPLLAPGIFCLAALAGLAATWNQQIRARGPKP